MRSIIKDDLDQMGLSIMKIIICIALSFFIGIGITLLLNVRVGVMVSLLVLASYIDIKSRIVPDTLIIGYFFIGIILMPDGPCRSLLGIILGGGLALLISIILNGGLGGGDIKLLGILGLMTGPKIVVVITLAIAYYLCFIILKLLIRHKNGLQTLPFVPFIFIAVIVQQLLNIQY